MIEANEIAANYIATWNATEPVERERLFARHWADDARYVDPLMAAGNAAELSGMIGAVQQRFPGFRFSLRGKPDGHNDWVRFSLGPWPGRRRTRHRRQRCRPPRQWPDEHRDRLPGQGAGGGLNEDRVARPARWAAPPGIRAQVRLATSMELIGDAPKLAVAIKSVATQMLTAATSSTIGRSWADTGVSMAVSMFTGLFPCPICGAVATKLALFLHPFVSPACHLRNIPAETCETNALERSWFLDQSSQKSGPEAAS